MAKNQLLLLVDLQNDFLSWGAYPIEGAKEVVKTCQSLLKNFEHIAATKEWMPANHVSFAGNHLWRKPGQEIEINSEMETIYTMHCVADTFGAEIVSEIELNSIDRTFLKGVDSQIPSFSCFYDKNKKRATGLSEYLLKNKIEQLIIAGLSKNHSIKNTIIEAEKLGIEVMVIGDAIASDKGMSYHNKLLNDFESLGAILIKSTEV